MSTAYVTSLVKELERIMQRKKVISEENKKLKGRSDEILKQLESFVENTSEKGIKCGNTVVFVAEVKKTIDTKKERESRLTTLLCEHNVPDPEQFTKEILRTMKGESTTVQKLRIKTE